MSADPKAPPAQLLRAIREAWLSRAIERLEADPAISAAGLVGSLGRGDADDWSDVDLLIVVLDSQVDHYADATQLPGSEQVTWSIDARHNAPRGAGSVAVRYTIDGLPLNVDWYVFPRSQAAWVADAKVIFDRDGLPRLNDTFYEHQEKREVQPPTPKAANVHPLLQVWLIPGAAKRSRTAVGRPGPHGGVRRRPTRTRGRTRGAPGDASTVARRISRRRTRGNAGRQHSLSRPRRSRLVDAPGPEEGKRCLTRHESNDDKSELRGPLNPLAMSAAEARQLMEQLWEGTDPRDLALSGAELAAASRRRITEEDEERVAFDRFPRRRGGLPRLPPVRARRVPSLRPDAA